MYFSLYSIFKIIYTSMINNFRLLYKQSYCNFTVYIDKTTSQNETNFVNRPIFNCSTILKTHASFLTDRAENEAVSIKNVRRSHETRRGASSHRLILRPFLIQPTSSGPDIPFLRCTSHNHTGTSLSVYRLCARSVCALSVRAFAHDADNVYDARYSWV